MPIRQTVPKPCSQPSNRAYPAGLAGNSATPSSPPIPSRAAATWVSAWVSTPPVTAAVLTMDIVIPFAVEGWHAPAGRRSRDPRPLVQARQIGTAPPVGATNNLGPGRQVVRKTTSGVSRLAGQAGTQATDPTPRPGQNPGSRAGTTYPHTPCRLWMSIDLVGFRHSSDADHPAMYGPRPTLAGVSGNDRQIIRGQLAAPGGLTGPYVASSGREATILRHRGEALAGVV